MKNFKLGETKSITLNGMTFPGTIVGLLPDEANKDRTAFAVDKEELYKVFGEHFCLSNTFILEDFYGQTQGFEKTKDVSEDVYYIVVDNFYIEN